MGFRGDLYEDGGDQLLGEQSVGDRCGSAGVDHSERVRRIIRGYRKEATCYYSVTP